MDNNVISLMYKYLLKIHYKDTRTKSIEFAASVSIINFGRVFFQWEDDNGLSEWQLKITLTQ